MAVSELKKYGRKKGTLQQKLDVCVHNFSKHRCSTQQHLTSFASSKFALHHKHESRRNPR